MVFGDDERHLLTLEAHLVGAQHRLHVHRQRRHPRQLQRLQQLARDDRFDLGMCFGSAGVDRNDARVRVRAAQNRTVEHARQVDIVDVVALASQETGVFLANHAAEAHGIARRRERRGGDSRCRHAVAPSFAGCAAAQRMAFTMFS